jgi:PHD/YefM family antitoxin component YafN of YafNO toxin-antitoxin module
MKSTPIPLSRFKRELNQVRRNLEGGLVSSYVITRKGNPVAYVIKYEKYQEWLSLLAAIEYHIK